MPTKTRKKRVNRFQILTLRVTLPRLVGSKKLGWWKKPKALLFSEESHRSEMTLMYQSINVYFTKKRLNSLCPPTFFPSIVPFFVDYPLGQKIYIHYDGNEDKVEILYHIPRIMYSAVLCSRHNTFFFLSLREGEKKSDKKSKRDREWSKSFVKAHYKDGRALLLLLLRGN